MAKNHKSANVPARLRTLITLAATEARNELAELGTLSHIVRDETSGDTVDELVYPVAARVIAARLVSGRGMPGDADSLFRVLVQTGRPVELATRLFDSAETLLFAEAL